MNIHEHQAKQILKKYGAVVPEGVFALDVDELIEKAKVLKTEKYVLKAQIHAGGRGKAGGVKIVNSIEQLSVAAKELLGKKLVTHQTGPEGKEVKRLYVEESSNIDKEFYEAGYNFINWDGKDKYGDNIANGVYLYTLKALKNGNTVSRIGKIAKYQ